MINYQNIKPWTKGYAVIFQNVQTAMDEAIAAVEEKLKRQQEIQNKKVCLYQIVHYDTTGRSMVQHPLHVWDWSI